MEKTGQTRRATLIKNGHQLNVDVRHDNQGINISILGEHNNPRVVEILQPRDILSGTSLQLRDRVSYSQTKADIGHLKSAYLAAFAKLGYAYILRRELNSVRQQIISPETQELGLLRLEARDGSNIQNDLFLFQSPVRCLGIKMGNVIICLPVDSEGLYEKLQEMRSVGWKETWQIKERCDWPDRFELALDFSGRYRIE